MENMVYSRRAQRFIWTGPCKRLTGENKMIYRRILLPLDGSALAEKAVPHALAQAEQFQAELILLKVLQPLAERGPSSPSHSHAEGVSKQLAREYLESVAAGIRQQHISVEVATIEGQAHAQIVRFAEENGVNLIVMSTRGQSGLSRWLMGSVADRVVRGATVPVLLIRVAETKVE